MDEYQTVTVEIRLKKGDDLYNRIQRYADSDGWNFEEAVQWLVTLGRNTHISNNLDLMERIAKYK